VLHDCVYAKTLDNITAVMIAFENYEKVCNDYAEKYPNNNGIKDYEKMMAERRTRLPIVEEDMEDEFDEIQRWKEG